MNDNNSAYNIKLKTIKISFILNQIDNNILTNITTIFNINKKSTIKEEIILEILEYLQNLNESEIEAFENTINNLKENPKIKNETNNIQNKYLYKRKN